MAVRTIILDCARLQPPNAGTIHKLARLQLLARRHGGSVRLKNPSASLTALIDLCGLAQTLGIETGRQAEEGEEPGGIEEEGDVGDPALGELEDL